MINREDLVLGAEFTQIDNTTDVRVLGVGENLVLLKHSNGVENTWGIESCLKCLKPKKKSGKMWINVYNGYQGTLSVPYRTKESADKASSVLECLACVEIDWEEGQGLE